MNLYNLSEIRAKIKKYELQQILDSGENDMFDDPIDKTALQKRINDLKKICNEEEISISAISTQLSTFVYFCTLPFTRDSPSRAFSFSGKKTKEGKKV